MAKTKNELSISCIKNGENDDDGATNRCAILQKFATKPEIFI